jgi:hypothetical protein
MRSVKSPELDPQALYDRVCAKRRSATSEILAAARPEVWGAYEEYETAKEPAMLSPLGARVDLRAALRTNYARFKSAHPQVYARLKLAARWCPYCGDRPVTGLDHYLPNSLFPEFSVLPLNLIPCCSDCNRIKDVNYVDEAGNPLFLHAYIDDVFQIECLTASVSTSTGVALLSFDVACPEEVGTRLAEKFRAHFDYLSLATFYRDRGEQEAAVRGYDVGSLLNAGYGPIDVRSHLLTSAEGARKIHGANHWRPVTLMALAASDTFCSGVCVPSLG